MGNKKELDIKTNMELGQLVKYLEDLAASLKQGKTFVQRGNEYVELTPSNNINVEISVTQKKDKEKFSLELQWQKKTQEEPRETLVISSQQPEIPSELEISSESAEESKEEKKSEPKKNKK